MSRPTLSTTSETVRDTYCLTRELKEAFEARVKELGRPSKSDVIRDLIEAWLRQTSKIIRLKKGGDQ